MTTATSGGWRDRLPPDRAWKARAGRAKAAVAREQDRAAGGYDRRWIGLEDGRFARASVELKVLPKTRRIRAYLRWYEGGRSPVRYLGEVDRSCRFDNLVEGWRIAWEKGLLAERPLPSESWAASPSVRSVMRGNKARDTGPEMKLRRLLHKRGLRYRVEMRPVPGLRRTADVVFTKVRLVVFVDGCYWHGCPEHYRASRTNQEFWRTKVEGNRQRDQETNAALDEAGWTVLRVWEHEDPEAVADRIEGMVGAAAGSSHDRAT